MSLTVSLSADCALARPVRPNVTGFNALFMSLGPSPGATARASVLPVPLLFPRAVSCVPLSAARALACPVFLCSPAAAGLGVLPVPLPSLLAVCALACPLRPFPGAPPVASHSSLRIPVAGTLRCPCTVPRLLDHAPGVLLPPQLRQRDARQRTCGRRGADRQRPPLGLVWVWLGLVWARYFATSLPSAAAAAAPVQALGAHGGPVPRAGSVPGDAVWPAGAVARLAGDAVSAPCAPGASSWGGAEGAAA